MLAQSCHFRRIRQICSKDTEKLQKSFDEIYNLEFKRLNKESKNVPIYQLIKR